MSKDEERALLFNLADELWVLGYTPVGSLPLYTPLYALGWSPPMSGCAAKWEAKTVITRGNP